MVSSLHEGLAGIATLDPGHTADALRALFELPVSSTDPARVLSGNLTECTPSEYRADAALLYGTEPNRFGVIVEVQLKPDQDKRMSWPAYITNLRARDECPTCLVVICPSRRTAKWASQPIEIGHPGLTLVPLVIGPDNTPVYTEVADAVGNIGLASIAAITQSKHPQINEILATLTAAWNVLGQPLAERYARYVLVSLTGEPQRELERLMAAKTYPYQGAYTEGLLAQGKAEGKAEGAIEKEVAILLMMLDSRSIKLSEDQRQRIVTCKDEALLDSWVKKAIFANAADEIFS
ncbi:hypothetical protein Acor_37130 [Acrocarpospora corrugata]|uniref:Transposase (putative) YhgA-like domain-containing protein n=1 Tax=Acrocarpospora corrugata TaxID=35763 RepID=A0A5M3W048_9ACTN|nr:hypothetical protein [Acrocarpospora corrugata]GES01649.1 hypothetical protein Acor_37130 [Acrocarpospora corrugata]